MTLLIIAFKLYELLIVARVLISWVAPDADNPVVELIVRLTEPLLGPVRDLIPTERIGVDLSPLIVLFLLEAVQKTILTLLF